MCRVDTDKQLCVTSDVESLNRILHTCSHIPEISSYPISNIEDAIIETNISNRSKLLSIIHSIHPISVFNTVDELNVEDEDDKRLENHQVLALLKFYMNKNKK